MKEEAVYFYFNHCNFLIFQFCIQNVRFKHTNGTRFILFGCPSSLTLLSFGSVKFAKHPRYFTLSQPLQRKQYIFVRFIGRYDNNISNCVFYSIKYRYIFGAHYRGYLSSVNYLLHCLRWTMHCLFTFVTRSLLYRVRWLDVYINRRTQYCNRSPSNVMSCDVTFKHCNQSL